MISLVQPGHVRCWRADRAAVMQHLTGPVHRRQFGICCSLSSAPACHLPLECQRNKTFSRAPFNYTGWPKSNVPKVQAYYSASDQLIRKIFSGACRDIHWFEEYLKIIEIDYHFFE